MVAAAGSVGDGERLGVVIWSGSGAPADTEAAFVSDWAMDPVFRSRPTAAGPTASAFSLADATRTSGLSLAELPGVTSLHVAGHPVAYDTDRRLWYSDLEIDAGTSYFPFVRLALARYQPNSVPDAHLSRVVRADFVQLAPDRSVVITRPRSTSRNIVVTVAGIGYGKAATTAGSSVMEVVVERKRANTDLATAQELGWEEVPGPAAVLTASAGPGDSTVWSGPVTLPAGSAGSLRVIVREVELIGGARRPVYADAIVI